MHFTRFISPYCVTDWAVFNNAADYSCSAPKIDLLMYSTFAVQSGESARQQRLALVLPYVLLWSIRAVDHLSKNDSRDDPRPSQTSRKDPRIILIGNADLLISSNAVWFPNRCVEYVYRLSDERIVQ
jgi:hypothetical protein